jgi:hypothetical protein
MRDARLTCSMGTSTPVKAGDSPMPCGPSSGACFNALSTSAVTCGIPDAKPEPSAPRARSDPRLSVPRARSDVRLESEHGLVQQSRCTSLQAHTCRKRPAGSDNVVYSSPVATACGSDQAPGDSAVAAATRTTEGLPDCTAVSAHQRALAPSHLSYPASAMPAAVRQQLLLRSQAHVSDTADDHGCIHCVRREAPQILLCGLEASSTGTPPHRLTSEQVQS